jgi:hypothetical protein
MHCKSCGVAHQQGHRFCPACGELYPNGTSDAALGAVAAQVRPLLQERARLSATLEELVDRASSRQLGPDERREWEQAYTRWRDLGLEIALALDQVHPRRPDDRRQDERRRTTTSPRRERRASERRLPDDRRDPFWGHAPED